MARAIRNPQVLGLRPIQAIRSWDVRGLPWLWLLALAVAVVAGLAPPLLTAALIFSVPLAILLLKRPVWGAYALVLSVPVQQTVELPGNITATQVLFVLVLGLWWAWLSLRQDRRLVITPIAATLFIFLVSTLPSLWGTTSLPDSLAEISRWLVTILSYIIIVNSVQTRREMNGLIVVMLVAGLSESVLGLVQAYAGIGPESFNVDGTLTRAYGTIGAPNSFAGYINMSVPLALALAAYQWGKWWSARKAAPLLERPSLVSWAHLRNPVLMSGVAILLFWTMVTTLSRGAWIGLAFGVLVMVLCLGKRASAAIGILIASILLLVGLAVAGAVPPVIADRFGQLTSQLTIFDPRGVVPTPDNYALVETDGTLAGSGQHVPIQPVDRGGHRQLQCVVQQVRCAGLALFAGPRAQLLSQPAGRGGHHRSYRIYDNADYSLHRRLPRAPAREAKGRYVRRGHSNRCAWYPDNVCSAQLLREPSCSEHGDTLGRGTGVVYGRQLSVVSCQ